jgi:hypothetical protein
MLHNGGMQGWDNWHHTGDCMYVCVECVFMYELASYYTRAS